MSFRVDLWNGLNIIKSQFNLTLNKISSLYNILLSYANCQKAHYKNLENLYKENKDKDIFKNDYLLDKSINELINSFKLESEYYRDHYKYIKHTLIVSLKEIEEKEKSSFNNKYNEGIQIQEDFIKLKNNLINKQNDYNNSLQDFYNFISNLTENNLLSILDNYNDYLKINEDTRMTKSHTMPSGVAINNIINDNINNQNIIKKDKLMEKMTDKRKEYSIKLDESNELLNSYNNNYENVLQSLEDNYHCLLDNMLISLNSTMKEKFNLINNISLLYNNYLNNNLNKIDIKKEIIEFITKNATKEFPIYKFELITNKYNSSKTFCIDINKYLKEKLENDKNVIQEHRGKQGKRTEIRNFRRRSVKKKKIGEKDENIKMVESNLIFSDIKQYKLNSNIYLIEDFIDEVINNKGETENNIDNKSYDDSSSKMIDINNIKLLLKKDNNDHLIYLDNIIKVLNNKRSQGNLGITKKGYSTLLDLFKFLLDNYSTYDFILKSIIILSQTYFTLEIDTENNKNNSKKKNEKIFIQNGLKNNPIFKKVETWHRIINFNLANNVLNKDISHPIDKNELNKKLNILMNHTFVSYLSDLKYFTDDENIFNEIKNYYVRVYQLDEDSINKAIENTLNIKPVKESKK